MANNKNSIVEIIKVWLKEEPDMVSRLEDAFAELMQEGFHDATVGRIHSAFYLARRPMMSDRERIEQQRFMDEAAGM